jgi:hypothetical protein
MLDLVGTGERKAVDRAMDLFHRMVASYVSALTAA